MTTKPATASLSFLILCVAILRCDSATPSSSLENDPGIDQGIADVRENAPCDVKEGVDVRQGPDDRIIGVVDRVEQQITHAGDSEVHLQKEAPGDEERYGEH